MKYKMKIIKNFLKNTWDYYCHAMTLAYYPYYMKHEK